MAILREMLTVRDVALELPCSLAHVGHLFPRAREEASAKLEEAIRKGRREAIASGVLADDDEINQREESPKYIN